jgi:hypothetical protein
VIGTYGRLKLLGSAADVDADVRKIGIALSPGQSEGRGSFGLVNTGGADGLVRLSPTCNCTVLSKGPLLVPAFSTLPVTFDVVGSSGQRKQVGYIQVIDDASEDVIAQVELTVERPDRTAVVVPREVDLRYGDSRRFHADLYVVALDAPSEVTWECNVPELQIGLRQVNSRHWAIRGELDAAPADRVATIRLEDAQGTVMAEVPVRLPTEVVGDVRVGWGASNDQAAGTRTFWTLVDPYYGSPESGVPDIRASGATIQSVELAPHGGLWIQLVASDAPQTTLRVLVNGASIDVSPPITGIAGESEWLSHQ